MKENYRPMLMVLCTIPLNPVAGSLIAADQKDAVGVTSPALAPRTGVA